VIGKHKYKNSTFGIKDLRYFVERGCIRIMEAEGKEEKEEKDLEEEEEGEGTGIEGRAEGDEEYKEAEEEEEKEEEEEEEQSTVGNSNTARINNTEQTQGKARKKLKYKIPPLRPLPPNVRYEQIARDTQGPLTEQEQTQLNRLRGGLPSLITRVGQQGKMNDENRARIALIKARIAELEDGEFEYGPYIGNTTTPTREEKEQSGEREGEEEETEGTKRETQGYKK